eukprot:COSAG01_NODE_225_length_21277_cov_71.340023_5_plen_35_part_00
MYVVVTKRSKGDKQPSNQKKGAQCFAAGYGCGWI